MKRVMVVALLALVLCPAPSEASIGSVMKKAVTATGKAMQKGATAAVGAFFCVMTGSCQ